MFELKLVLFLILVDFLSDIVGTPDIKSEAHRDDVMSPFPAEKDFTESLICDYKDNMKNEFKLICKENRVYIRYGENNVDNFKVSSCEIEKTMKSFFAPIISIPIDVKITMYIVQENTCEVKEYKMDKTQSEIDPAKKSLDDKDFKVLSTKSCKAELVYDSEDLDDAYTYLNHFTTCLPMTKELGKNVKELLDDRKDYAFNSGWPNDLTIESGSPEKLLSCSYEDNVKKLKLLCQSVENGNGGSEKKYEVFINEETQLRKYKVQRMFVSSCSEDKIISSIFPAKKEKASPYWITVTLTFSLDTGKCLKRTYRPLSFFGRYSVMSSEDIDCPSGDDDWAPDKFYGQSAVWQSCSGPLSAEKQVKPIQLFTQKAKPID